MRLSNYLKLSSDNDTSSFRSMSINLVDDDIDGKEIINNLPQVTNEVTTLIDRANKELKSIYRGKMRFDLCIEDKGNTPDEIKIDKIKKEKLKEMWYEFNDDLSEIQNNFEIYLKSIK